MPPAAHRAPLPIDVVLPAIVEAARARGAVVIEAPPGAGKTTRVPWALLDSGLLGDAEVLVLEPRRIAARLSARRVAEEIGEPVGGRVGYSVRFEDVGSARTRLRFVTHGVLLRRILADFAAGQPPLPAAGAVVFDEFHERTLEGDLALALLARSRRLERPQLRLLAMSATLDGEPLAAWLDAERIRSEGRVFAVAVDHAPTRDERPLETQVAAAVRRLIAEGLDGDVLVFLPGAREIQRVASALAPLAASADLALHSLHGDQSPVEQERAVRPDPAGRRKVILSTNVAETSLTIDGVVAVVDSGLARRAAHDPWSGLPTLRLTGISRAACAQRAGRAGRTRPGRALRLFTRHDHDGRPEFETPEIRRQDLADAVLLLHGVGIEDPAALAWFEAPPAAALAAAETLLARLGALDDARALTAIGRRLLRFPLHPRLGRLLVEAEDLGAGAAGALAAALLGEGRRGGAPGPTGAAASGSSDVVAAMERRPHPEPVLRAQRLLAGLTRGAPPGPHRAPPTPATDVESALGMALLAAFPDRVARRRRPHAPDVLLAGGGTATLAPSSVVREPEWMVAIEVEERREAGRAPLPVVRVASAIEVEWLLQQPAALRDEVIVELDPVSGRVEALRRLRYDQLTVEDRTIADPDPEQLAAVLAAAAMARGGARGATGDRPEEIERLIARMAFVAAARPQAGIAAPDEAALADALRRLCAGRRRLADLKETSLCAALIDQLDGPGRRLLAEVAPERVALPGGRTVRVEYAAGQAPWLASRLQDFFGMDEGPHVAGRALTLHLLAPNQRAVQVTSDLAGFWHRHYPALRRELMRRYPKHAWPEDPLRAPPPRPRAR